MDSTSTIILIVALFIIMTGMGLSLTGDDFKRVLKEPKAVFIGFLNQIILLPLIAYGLTQVIDVDPTVAVGIMILAACPGGPTSNLLTLLAKGDAALSVTLTAINSLITIITIPLIVNFGVGEFMSESSQINAPIGKIIGSLVVVIAIPLALGIIIRKSSESLAAKLEKPVKIASGSLLVLIIIGLLIKEKANLGTYFESALLITLLLNISTMAVGFITAKLSGLSFKQALTICLESGNQNGTLAIHVAVVSLARPDFAIAAAVYSVFMYVTASVPIFIGNKKG